MGPGTVTTYRDSHLGPGKGRAYDGSFHYPYLDFLWSREQAVLRSIVERYYRGLAFDYLDFACGTGRILAYMEGLARTSTGVDISAEMLAQAREKVTRSELVLADITRENPLQDRRFGLITAFRFFLNAEPPLRVEAIKALAKLLTDDGLLVFNNHLNRHSAMGLVLRLRARLRGEPCITMTLREMKALAHEGGLEVVAVEHTGVLPGEARIMLAPRAWYTACESVLSRVPVLRHVARLQVLVCRRRR